MARTRRAELTAYHEAGHAVLGMYYRLPVLHATLGPEGRRGGARVVLKPDWAYRAIEAACRPAELGPRQAAAVDKRVMCLLGGFAAETVVMRHWSKSWPIERPLFMGLVDFDLALKYAWLRGIAPGRRCGFIARLYKPTMEIIVSVWPAVIALAAALLEHRTLTVKRMRSIALRAMRHTPKRIS